MHRVQQLVQHVGAEQTDAPASKDTITIVDNRNGKSYTLKITNNTISPPDLKQIKNADGKPLKTFDPGYMNTCCCISTISFIDGDKGILRYRGYPIEQLADKSSFTECCYLLNYGELPSKPQLDRFNKSLVEHMCSVSTEMIDLHKAFRYDAHPMAMIGAAFAALGAFFPDQNPSLVGQDIYKDARVRNKQVLRVLGAGPALAAMGYRHRIGKDYVGPREDLSYTENLLYMMDAGRHGEDFKPHPTLVKAIDVLLLLHAEHELNCSTSAMRHLASSNADVFAAISGACGALYGPRHGGANEAVLRMLEVITGPKYNSDLDKFIADVKNKKAKLMGFGHRVYKSYDPRARIVRKIADEVFTICGADPMINVAMKLEKAALEDEYFKGRKLYPNVDFYSGLIYKAMGIPTDMFTVFFTIPRLAGWLAHWQEWVIDPENRIYRPFQVYKGVTLRDYESMDKRKGVDKGVDPGEKGKTMGRSALNMRRDVSKGGAREEYGGIKHGIMD